MKAKSGRNILLVLLAFLGFVALFGGSALIISPSGHLLGIPHYLQKNSPDNNFLIPGIILFLILGLTPIWLMIALIKTPESKIAGIFNFYIDMYCAWTYSIYIAFALIIWLQLEMFLLQRLSRLHAFYMFYAIALIFTSLLPKV